MLAPLPSTGRGRGGGVRWVEGTERGLGTNVGVRCLQSIRRRGAPLRVDREEAVVVGHLYAQAALVAVHRALKVDVVVS